MTPLRVVIVDDEPPARALLAELLGQIVGVEVVAQAAGGAEAVEVVATQADAGTPVDALFLDVQMPELDGFGVLAALAGRGALPAVVFATAYDRHAIGAFETGAVDYLLKPVTRSRLTTAVERLRARRGEAPMSAGDVQALAQAAPLGRLLVRVGDRLVAVDPDEIVYVEAAGNYATLHTAGRPLVASVGIGEVEARLPAGAFVRVHRSALVALSAVRQLEPDGNGGFEALLTGGHRVRVSRTYAERFRRLIL